MRAFPRPRWRYLICSALIALLGALLWPLGRGAIQASPAPGWSAPYCGHQPRITAIFDHELPLYGRDGILRLFNSADIFDCNGPGYDGHSGWDFARSGRRQGCGAGWRQGVQGDLVFAAESGRVREARWFHESQHDLADGVASGFGLYVDLDHGLARGTAYGHLAALFVEEGEQVARGQLIGALGATGFSSGPHLHFQAAKQGLASDAARSFDPYGWDRRFDAGPPDPPAMTDPHVGPGWSERRIVPGQDGPACPAACGEWIVEDDSPGVTYGCRSTPSCPYWFESAKGHGGGHHWTHPNGAGTDYVADYRCTACPPGSYLVEAYVPMGGDIANTHIARYEVGSEVTVMDQHTEGGVWHPIGLFDFAGQPRVRLTDRSDRYNYTAPGSQKIGADALRFTRICDNLPPGTPRIDSPSAPGDGAG